MNFLIKTNIRVRKGMHPPGAQVLIYVHPAENCAHIVQGAPLISNTEEVLINLYLHIDSILNDNVHLSLKCTFFGKENPILATATATTGSIFVLFL